MIPRSSSFKNWISINPSRYYLEKFLEQAASSLPDGAWVLDAGAGDCRYAYLFAHTNYLSIDFAQVDKQYGALDIIADLASVPLTSEQFDAIICTQVLEHLPKPWVALAEFYRLLRPGGTLWLTAPFYYEEHETPFDFYRYTRYGLMRLCEDAGFTIESIEWLEGYWGTLSYQWRSAAYILPWASPTPNRQILSLLLSAPILSTVKLVLAAMGFFAAYLDLWKRDRSRWHCKNYQLIAHKPSFIKA